jgi:hypothetical protein
MSAIARVLSTFLLVVFIAYSGRLGAQGAPVTIERFAGEAQIGSAPPFPIHLELRRSGESVTGTVSTPRANYELVEAQGAETIAGRFRGNDGSGALTLRIDGDVLTGAFDVEDEPGAITARRTHQDAETFFQPPEQRLNLTSAQWLEDLDRLVETLTREHASPFHRTSRERFEREAARVRAAIPELDGVAVALEFSKLGALIGDGHTSVALPRGRPRLPIEFYWFEDGLRVVGVPAAHQSLLGARLVAVNDVPAAEVAERLRAFIAQGEREWLYRAGAPDLVNNTDVLRATGIGATPLLAFTFETADGSRRRIELAAAAEEDERVTLGGGVPLWRRNETQGFWSEGLADGSVYVNWRSYDGLPGHGAALLQSSS